MKDFNQIYTDFHKMVLTYAAQKLPMEVAEELTQDVFMKVYNNLHKYDESKAKLSTWIMNITRHAVIDKWRKVKLDTMSINSLVDDDEKEFFEVSVTDNPLSEMMNGEYQKAVRDVVLELPKTYKRMANLFFNCELNYEEISERMNVPIGTVKGKISRARSIMKEKIAVL